MKKRTFMRYCLAQQEKYPERITARVILINDNNEIYFLKYRDTDELFWLPPGGKIEEGETPLEAAKRELYEETGIMDRDVHFILPHSWYFETVSTLVGTTILTLFKEYFFVGYTQSSETTTAYLNADERKHVIGGAWWNIGSFIESNEILYPPALLSVLPLFVSVHKKNSECADLSQRAL